MWRSHYDATRAPHELFGSRRRPPSSPRSSPPKKGDDSRPVAEEPERLVGNALGHRPGAVPVAAGAVEVAAGQHTDVQPPELLPPEQLTDPHCHRRSSVSAWKRCWKSASYSSCNEGQASTITDGPSA